MRMYTIDTNLIHRVKGGISEEGFSTEAWKGISKQRIKEKTQVEETKKSDTSEKLKLKASMVVLSYLLTVVINVPCGIIFSNFFKI